MGGTKTKLWHAWHKEQYPLTFSVWYLLGGRKYHSHYKHREVDPELERDFEAFLEEVGPRPRKDMTLDRIDNEQGYIKGNLRWATLSQQQRNTRSNHIYKGKTIVEWSEISGINADAIRRRIRKGWNYERAIWQPLDTKCQRFGPRS